MDDQEQKIMDLEQELEGEKEMHKSDVFDLKYFYTELLEEYLTVLKESGLSTNLEYSRHVWENKIKIY